MTTWRKRTTTMLNKLMETRAHNKIDIARQRSQKDHRVRYIVALANGEYRITLRQPTIGHFWTNGWQSGTGLLEDSDVAGRLRVYLRDSCLFAERHGSMREVEEHHNSGETP